MAYDIEIQTPRGRIGFNILFHTGPSTMVLHGFVDGVNKGTISLAGEEQSGTAQVILLECLKDEGIIPQTGNDGDLAAWLASTPQEQAVVPILRWLYRGAIATWVAFANRIIGVTPNPNPTPAPGPTPSTFFVNSEHALRGAAKSLIWSVNQTTSEVSARLP